MAVSSMFNNPAQTAALNAFLLIQCFIAFCQLLHILQASQFHVGNGVAVAVQINEKSHAKSFHSACTRLFDKSMVLLPCQLCLFVPLRSLHDLTIHIEFPSVQTADDKVNVMSCLLVNHICDLPRQILRVGVGARLTTLSVGQIIRRQVPSMWRCDHQRKITWNIFDEITQTIHMTSRCRLARKTQSASEG